jgi:hypothetical protein
MTNDDSRPAGSSVHLDARQCERLIGLACSTEKPRPAADGSQPIQNADRNATRAQRSSLTEAMIGLILGPDAFEKRA